MKDFFGFGQDFLPSVEEPEVALKQFFLQRGFVRIPDKERRAISVEYKKGWEVRLIIITVTELIVIRRWLGHVGLKPGKPYRRHSRIIQPIYGKAAIKWFLSEE